MEFELGNPKAREEFNVDYSGFIKLLPSLNEIIEKLFDRSLQLPQSAADYAIFRLGQLMVMDFDEILLLCGNGFGLGALKLLRGLYERVLICRYLSINPDKAQDYWDYGHVARRKQLNLAKEAGMADKINQQIEEDVESNYQRVKSRFDEIICDRCNKKRTRASWSSLDTASMARTVGQPFDKLYVQAFFEPTMQLHATVPGVLNILRVENGQIVFDDNANRERIHEVIQLSHYLLLEGFVTQNVHFKLGFESQIQNRFSDFFSIWAHQKKTSM